MAKLRFLHIPKTAGTTFNSILKRQYFLSEVFYFTGSINLDKKKYEALEKYKQNNIELFLGHARLVTGIENADNTKIITFLRDPISRVKSFCQYVSVGKSSYLRKEFPPDKFDLDKFLESGNDELSNLQTKMLINRDISTPPISDISASLAINIATDNLFNKIFRYGLQEYFDESLMIFADALNWRMPFYETLNKKVENKSIKFEEKHISKIMELNKMDIEVYKLAKERFISSINDRVFDKSKLNRFRSMNKPASVIIKGARQLYRKF